MSSCKICGNTQGNESFVALEMMRGTRDKFDYLECVSCGTVQLVDPPGDMSSYYANDVYGSFGGADVSILKMIVRNCRNRFAILGEGGWFGRMLSRRNPLPSDYCLINKYATKHSKILDVGCGRGAYMVDLKNIGFSNVSGIDPFLEREITHSNGVVISRKSFEEINEKYDVIISHHSFEHVANPMETLICIKNSLVSGGVVLLTVPIADALYKKYKENCYLIQAPQHFFLMTVKSMMILAEKSGLNVNEVVRDADSMNDWSQYSELWKRGVAVNEVGKSIDVHFDDSEVSEMNDFVNALKSKGEGDNVTFILSLPKTSKLV